MGLRILLLSFLFVVDHSWGGKEEEGINFIGKVQSNLIDQVKKRIGYLKEVNNKTGSQYCKTVVGMPFSELNEVRGGKCLVYQGLPGLEESIETILKIDGVLDIFQEREIIEAEDDTLKKVILTIYDKSKAYFDKNKKARTEEVWVDKEDLMVMSHLMIN